MKLEKKELRRECLARRNALSETEQAEYSRKIAERVLALQENRQAESIFLYASYLSEVQTDALIEKYLQSGKKVALPKMEQGEMKFYYISSPEELVSGYKGIREPVGSSERLAVPEKNDMMLLPGTAFDRKLGRIGYGGGNYDRYLDALEESCIPWKIGLCYEIQMVEQVPVEEHDVRLDGIVTEQNVVMTSRLDK